MMMMMMTDYLTCVSKHIIMKLKKKNTSVQADVTIKARAGLIVDDSLIPINPLKP